MKKILQLIVGLLVISLPITAQSVELLEKRPDLTNHFVGYIALLLLGIAYILVILEEKIHLHKSKPVLLAAGIIWVLIAIVYQNHDIDTAAKIALRHDFLEFSELFFSCWWQCPISMP